jgi:hypothetical protein
MFRTDTPITFGEKSRAARNAVATGLREKHKSRNRTLCPAASSAEATHAMPFGTTGYG